MVYLQLLCPKDKSSKEVQEKAERRKNICPYAPPPPPLASKEK